MMNGGFEPPFIIYCSETELKAGRLGFECRSKIRVKHIAGRVFEIQTYETEIQLCSEINGHRYNVDVFLFLLERFAVQRVACLYVSSCVETYNRSHLHIYISVEIVSIHE